MLRLQLINFFFFFNDTATTEIYTLSLHDALPICCRPCVLAPALPGAGWHLARGADNGVLSEAAASDAKDRKSTRLNSSHSQISYAVFCLKKKKANYCICSSVSAPCCYTSPEAVTH